MMIKCRNCKYAVEGDINAQTLKAPLMCFKLPPITSIVNTQQGLANLTVYPDVSGDNMGCHAGLSIMGFDSVTRLDNTT